MKSYRGQSLSEYALIIALIAVLVVIILATLGVSLSSVYCGIVSIFSSNNAQCGSNVLLSDPFDDLSGWSFTAGNGWRIRNGVLQVGPSGEHRGFTGDTSWSDYTVRVQESTLTRGDGYGVYFRVTNEPAINGYVFQYDPGYRGGAYPNGAFLIRKVVNGNETPPIAVSAAPADYQWTDTTREVSVDVRGDTFIASVDNVEVLQTSDSQFADGRVGLRTWDSSNATFDNFQVSQ